MKDCIRDATVVETAVLNEVGPSVLRKKTRGRHSSERGKKLSRQFLCTGA